MAEPDAVVAGHYGRHVYMRRYTDGTLGRLMLLRIVVGKTEGETVVITVYKTSQVDRYLPPGGVT